MAIFTTASETFCRNCKKTTDQRRNVEMHKSQQNCDNFYPLYFTKLQCQFSLCNGVLNFDRLIFVAPSFREYLISQIFSIAKISKNKVTSHCLPETLLIGWNKYMYWKVKVRIFRGDIFAFRWYISLTGSASSKSHSSLLSDCTVVHLQLFFARTAHLLWTLNLQTRENKTRELSSKF